MPAAGVEPADRAGGMDTFVRYLIDLGRRRPELDFDFLGLSPDGEEMPATDGSRFFYIRSRLLIELLFAHRYASNPVANMLLLAATAAALVLRGIGPLRRTRYDAIYAVGGPISGLAGAVLGTIFRIPVIAHFQVAYRFAEYSSLMRRAVRAFYERFSLVIGNSRLNEEDAAQLHVAPTTRFTHVYNSVDAAFYRPLPDRAALRRKWGIPQDRFVFLHAGRFDWVKQTDLVARALGERRYDATFLFAGDGAVMPQLRAIEHVNDLRLLGTRGPADLVELHNVADVLLWGSVDADYPSLVVMESMASGLPVTIPRTSQNPLYLERPIDADLLGGPALSRRYPATPDGVAQAIREALERPQELAAQRPAVRAFAIEHFGEANENKLVGLLLG